MQNYPTDKFLTEQELSKLTRLFWRKVCKCGPVPTHRPELGSCWIWIGAKNRYGRICTKWLKIIPHEELGAHVVSWMIHHLEFPRLQVLHHCDNMPCVRPDHLFLGTQSDNVADRTRKGRSVQGEQQWKHKLSAELVKNIRTASENGEFDNMIQVDIAARYGVSRAAIMQILERKTWKHVE